MNPFQKYNADFSGSYAWNTNEWRSSFRSQVTERTIEIPVFCVLVLLLELETIDLIAAINSVHNTIQQNTQVYPGVRSDTNARTHISSVIQTHAR